jgi:hypothetical protein
MQYTQLLTVEERFQLTDDMLVVVPDFPLPKGRWSNLTGEVEIVPPNGNKFAAVAELTLAHFNIRDPAAGAEKRWRVLLKLPGLRKELVPVGSRVLASVSLVEAVTQGNAI